MAHELTMREDGTVEMFYAGDTPWHRLGTKVEGLLTSHEAIKAANLDWRVEIGPLHTPDGDLINGFHRTYRTDNDLTLGVGAFTRYRVLQNSEAFGFMDELVGEHLAMFETAGSIKEGRQVWTLAKLPEHITVGDEDTIEQYIVISNTHDGTGCVTIKPTPIRVVCNNTLTWALGLGGSQFKIRHSKNMMDKVGDARDALGIINENFIELGGLYQDMLNRDLTDEEYQNFIIEVVGMNIEKTRGKNLYDKIEEIYTNDPTNQVGGMSGTLWAGYNALTYWVDHERGVKADGTRRENAQREALFGSGDLMKRKAMTAGMAIL